MRCPLLPSKVVKQQVAAHWNWSAQHFGEDFGHSIRTPGELVAWGRILNLDMAYASGSRPTRCWSG